MIEATIKLRYAVQLPHEGYPRCLSEQDAADYDKRSYETGMIDVRDLIEWSLPPQDDEPVNNSGALLVSFAVVEPHDPGAPVPSVVSETDSETDAEADPIEVAITQGIETLRATDWPTEETIEAVLRRVLAAAGTPSTA